MLNENFYKAVCIFFFVGTCRKWWLHSWGHIVSHVAWRNQCLCPVVSMIIDCIIAYGISSCLESADWTVHVKWFTVPFMQFVWNKYLVPKAQSFPDLSNRTAAVRSLHTVIVDTNVMEILSYLIFLTLYIHFGTVFILKTHSKLKLVQQIPML